MCFFCFVTMCPTRIRGHSCIMCTRSSRTECSNEVVTGGWCRARGSWRAKSCRSLYVSGMPRAVLANTIYGKLHFVGRPTPTTLISFDAKTQVNICRRSSLGIHLGPRLRYLPSHPSHTLRRHGEC